MATALAQVLRHFGPQYLDRHCLSTPQARAWRAIVACRTAALGGQQLVCEDCGAPQWRLHSCRNRHCPQCQSRAREAWRSARLAELLNVPYSHLVFTLPHELNALAALHPRWVYDTLMQCTAATLSEFAANPRWLGGTGAFTLVLHTWTQDLRRHLHVHALMACGAMQCDEQGNSQWVQPKRSPHFLFPVQALSQVFRGKFLQALVQAEYNRSRLGADQLQLGSRHDDHTVGIAQHDVACGHQHAVDAHRLADAAGPALVGATRAGAARVAAKVILREGLGIADRTIDDETRAAAALRDALHDLPHQGTPGVAFTIHHQHLAGLDALQRVVNEQVVACPHARQFPSTLTRSKPNAGKNSTASSMMR